MGAKGQNYHTKLMQRMGFEEEALKIQDLFFAGKRDEAIMAVPDDFADEISIVGPPSRIKERLAAWRAEPGHHAAGRGPRPRAAQGRARPRPRLSAAPMAKHPFHDVAIVGVHNTEAGARARGARLADHHLGSRDGRDRRRRDHAARHRRDRGHGGRRHRCTRPAVVRSGARTPAWASPRCSRSRAPSPTGSPPTVLISAGSAGVYTDRASTAPWTRPTHEFVAPVRHVHRGRVRAHRPPAHAHVRHDARKRSPPSPRPSATTVT